MIIDSIRQIGKYLPEKYSVIILEWLKGINPKSELGFYDIVRDDIYASDVVVTILSQTAYEALLREKPVVMMGYIQLKHSGCTYEAFHISEVEEQIKAAVQQGYTKEQKKCFIRHVARLCRYYLYDDMQHEEFPYGRKIGE